MNKSSITIDHAIEIIKLSGESFKLTFVRSSGKKKGSIKVSQFRYGAPIPQIKASKQISKSKGSHKLSGTIPLTEVETNKYSSPLISHIIGINDFLVKH